MRFFVRILAVLGILALVGLVTGLAYSAGLSAAGVAVHPAVYGFGLGFFGFGLFHFFGFILFLFLLLALLRVAFGGRRGWGGRGGWGPYGRGFGPGDGAGYGPGQTGPTQPGSDPREAWIRGRLDDWHRSAHAGAPTGPTPAAGASGDEPNPPA
jgi:hypothetical protein